MVWSLAPWLANDDDACHRHNSQDNEMTNASCFSGLLRTAATDVGYSKFIISMSSDAIPRSSNRTPSDTRWVYCPPVTSTYVSMYDVYWRYVSSQGSIDLNVLMSSKYCAGFSLCPRPSWIWSGGCCPKPHYVVV